MKAKTQHKMCFRIIFRYVSFFKVLCLQDLGSPHIPLLSVNYYAPLEKIVGWFSVTSSFGIQRLPSRKLGEKKQIYVFSKGISVKMNEVDKAKI